MIRELLNSTGHVVTERIRNPFIGSFILAWFYLNWELLILLINLPSDGEHTVKIELIRTYITENVYDLVLFPILYSIILLISYGLVASITLIITSFFQKTLRPRILGFFDKNLIIEKHTYNNLKETYSKLLMDFDILQQSYYGISKEREELKTRFLQDTEKELERIRVLNENLLNEANLEKESIINEAKKIKEKIIEEARTLAMKEAEVIITDAKVDIDKYTEAARDFLDEEAVKKGMQPAKRIRKKKE